MSIRDKIIELLSNNMTTVIMIVSVLAIVGGLSIVKILFKLIMLFI